MTIRYEKTFSNTIANNIATFYVFKYTHILQWKWNKKLEMNGATKLVSIFILQTQEELPFYLMITFEYQMHGQFISENTGTTFALSFSTENKPNLYII